MAYSVPLRLYWCLECIVIFDFLYSSIKYFQLFCKNNCIKIATFSKHKMYYC